MQTSPSLIALEEEEEVNKGSSNGPNLEDY